MAQQNTQPAIRKNITWSTKMVDSWMMEHAEGTFHKENPWLDGQVGVKRAGLLFDYTPEEIEELTKSANDVIYFANNYGYCLHGRLSYCLHLHRYHPMQNHKLPVLKTLCRDSS